MARQRMDEVHIFLEEDIHNVTLQEEATKLEMTMRRGEDNIANDTKVYSHL